MKIRFIAKPWDAKTWGVYDTVLASWPHRRPELGKVKQQVTKKEAEAEAERLEALVRP